MDSGATLKSIVINKIDEPIAAYWDYPNQLKLNFTQHLDIKQPDKYTKATCSYKDMMKERGVSTRSISRAISLLEENRLVTVYKR